MINSRIRLACYLSFIMMSGASCGVSGGSAGHSRPVATTAVRNSDFLSSIGVNTAVSGRGESLARTIEICRYLGISWIRSGYEGGLPTEDLMALHRETGVKFSYGLLSGGSDTGRLLAGARQLAAAGALLALEGPNEPNNWRITYRGEQGGGRLSWLPVARLQHDLYTAVRRDPLLKDYPVWGLTEGGAQTDNTGLQFLVIPGEAHTLMPPGTRYADYANCHNYFMHPSHPGLYDNQTWNAADPTPQCKVDGLYGNYGLTWLNHFEGYSGDELASLSRVTTETGAVVGKELTEEKQARLYMNLYLAQFKRGWRYTAVYLLRDRSDEAGNQQFGFYKADYTPRTAARYLHNLTALLSDSNAIGRTGSLAYSIPEKPETVHDLLLQKSDGTFNLILWDERVSGSDEVLVRFGTAHKDIKVCDPTRGTTPVYISRGKQHALSLTLSDHPLVITLPGMP